MASQNIYTPTVNSYEPAFIYRFITGTGDIQTGDCKVYFVLSDYNTRADIGYAHASIIQASTNYNVVDTDMDQSGSIKTAAGLILNLPIQEVVGRPGLYYVTISGDYINDNAKGWSLGSIYKIQLRLTSTEEGYECTATDAEAQISWLNVNANKFSEWSTTVTTKAIGKDTVEIPLFNGTPLKSHQIDIIGTYQNEDVTEKMYSARVKIFKYQDLVEDSGVLYKSSLDSSSKFSYSSKRNYTNWEYYVEITIVTINKHEYVTSYRVSIDVNETEEIKNLSLVSSIEERGFEEDEGCIALKIISSVPNDTYQGTLRIRRSSEKDNFATWEDLHEIKCESATSIADIPLYKDFTAESGTYYKYGLEKITWDGPQIIRSITKMTPEISREYDYSFLLGEGGRQLKLRYDLNLNNFQKTYSDVITPTIGGEFPIVTRVGAANYYSFSANGKISFSMDENNLFLKKDFAHGYTPDSYINQYDRTYERLFRNEVYNFLTDGKPKLFKSPTEGNIIVRLTNVGLSPINNLSRLIYNFSATFTEVDKPTFSAYKKYHFVDELNNTILKN